MRISLKSRKRNRQTGTKLKRTVALIMALISCASVFGLTAAAADGESYYAFEGKSYEFPKDLASVNVTLDGKSILQGEATIINSVTYVPVRRFAEIVGADSVTWNAKTRTATVKDGNTTVTIAEGAYYISANGRYFYTVERVLNINGKLFVPVRPICQAFCIDVGWDAKTRTAVLKSTGKTLVSGAAYYNSDDLYWLSRIISAEASGEILKGKIAVGNVVLNRVESKSYPNTIYGVIFDRKGGTQFSPVSMGTIYKTPTAESVIAAKICLEGYSISDSILFFMNPKIATSNWISKNRPYAFTIGNHDFYN